MFIATSFIKALRRPLEPALRTLVGLADHHSWPRVARAKFSASSIGWMASLVAIDQSTAARGFGFPQSQGIGCDNAG
jgi:hypothetical protein